MKTYRVYRKVGMSRLAAIRGQWHAVKLGVYYLPGEFCNWWLWQWHITLPWLRWWNLEEFKKKTIVRKKQVSELFDIFDKDKTS